MQYVRNFVNTTVTATLYTVIESCKKAQLDPKSYILMAVRKKIEEKKEVPTVLKYAKKSEARLPRNLALPTSFCREETPFHKAFQRWS